MPTETPDLGYISHMPVLGACMSRILPSRNRTSVLECGSGHGSTHLIHLQKFGYQIVSVDTDEKWLATFADYASESHKFHLVRAEVQQGSSGINEYIKAWIEFLRNFGDIDVAFLDCWPGEARVPIIQALKGRAVCIVAHDLEADEPPGGGNYGWKKLAGLFKYHRVFKRLRPWTGFWSDHFDMPELE